MATIAIDYTPAIRQTAGIGRIVRGQVDAVQRLIQRSQLEYDTRLFVVGKLTPNQRQSASQRLFDTWLDERNMVRLWHRIGSPWPSVERFTGGPLDLFHATDFVLAPNHARRTIVTVHDLAFLHYPDASHPSLYRYLNVVVPRSIRKADHIIADSHHTAGDVSAFFHVTDERISVAQGAVDHDTFTRVTNEQLLQAARAKYRIDERPYIFALSSLQPRKNFARLIKAFSIAKMSASIEHQLVIAGGKGWLYDDIFASVRDLKLENDVGFIGFVEDSDLPALYSSADFFAYPSLYEGFGLPIIEALACGTAVITADNSCLPEAGGPGALYVDAENTDSIADGLMRMCTDAALKQELVNAGLKHVSQFTWERVWQPAPYNL